MVTTTARSSNSCAQVCCFNLPVQQGALFLEKCHVLYKTTPLKKMICQWVNRCVTCEIRCRDGGLPSGGSLREWPDVAVRRNPAGSVSADPGIILIPWTSRGGNCLLHDGPLKSLSSHWWTEEQHTCLFVCFLTQTVNMESIKITCTSYINTLYFEMSKWRQRV